MTGNDGDSSELDRLAESIMAVMEVEDSKIYSKEVIDEFRNPVNVGIISTPDGAGIADGLCNDTMEITLRVRDGTIIECLFFTDGCGASIACGSRLTRMAIGRSMGSALDIQPQELVDALGGLPDDHKHCASLAVIALKNAIRDFNTRRSRGGVG